MTADHPERRTEAFFGRRRGKRLRPRQRAALDALLPRLRLDPSRPPPADLRVLFADPVDEVHLEIGFGGGEHLLDEIGRYRGTGFIGVEPFLNGMAKLLCALGGRVPGNLRLHDDDAVALLDWLPAASLSRIDLLYPDPWPKKRHWKRRFVGPANLERIARVLKPGAAFRFASDIDGYVEWTLEHVGAHGAFRGPAPGAGDGRTPFPGWPGTRYEAKALREGRRPAYLTFVRL